MDITLPENSAWYNKYKYDIPVFHLNGKFLMKHRVDLQKFEDRLRKLELQREGNQWRKCSCSDADLKRWKELCEKNPYSLSGLKFLRTYESEKLKLIVVCFVLISQPSCIRSHLFCAVHFCSCEMFLHWQNKSCSVTADKVNSVCMGLTWPGLGSGGVVQLLWEAAGSFPCVQLSQYQSASGWTLWPCPRPSMMRRKKERMFNKMTTNPILHLPEPLRGKRKRKLRVKLSLGRRGGWDKGVFKI